MKLIGLSGPAGVGKDTIADYLVETYGFVKFSFADPLYREVADAFDMSIEDLTDRTKKEEPSEALQYWYCKDKRFQRIMFERLRAEGSKYPSNVWCSPRQVLQWWGTEYRRQQDPEYWIKRADEFVRKWLARGGGERAGLVQTSVRFPNERAFIEGWNGEVWHVRRPTTAKGATARHVAEQGLPVEPRDKVVHNDGTIERLNTTASLMLSAAPETVYYCTPAPVVEAVQCKACGCLHRAYTRAEAEAEIATVTDWRSRQTEHLQRALAKYPLAIEQYIGCHCCESNQFEPADAKLLGPMTPPVIYEY